MSTIVAVFVGGMVGTLLRAVASQLWTDLPWATLSVNLVGAMLLGGLAGSLARRRDPLLLNLIGVGLLGSLTTFSTYALEVVELAGESSPAIAVAYAGASVGLGVMAVAGGYRVVSR